MDKRVITVGILSILFASAILAIVAYSMYLSSQIHIATDVPLDIKTYSDNYWNGKYIFCLANTETQVRDVDYTLLVTLDAITGNLTIFSNSSTYFNYIYQLDNDIIFYKLEGDNNPIEFNIDTREIESEYDFNVDGHHELLIRDGYFVTLRRDGSTEGLLDTIVEVNATNGEVIWEWSTVPYFPEKVCEGSRPNDWLHSNDVTVTRDGVGYYINFRNADSFGKVNRATGELEWICGKNGNFTLLNENGVEVDSLWYHSHIVTEISHNRFIMFDNDFHNVSNTYANLYQGAYSSNYGGRSRLIMFEIDEDLMTCKIIWSYTPSEEHFCSGFGDIDLLPNGNILGTFGQPAHKFNKDGSEHDHPFGASMIEVTLDGELVREYIFPYHWGIYRMQILQ